MKISFSRIGLVGMLFILAFLNSGCDVIVSILRALGRYCETTEWVVNTSEDLPRGGYCTEANCSLRMAVNSSNLCPGVQTIHIPSGTYVLTIADRRGYPEHANRSGDLDLTDGVNIIGDGMPVIDGNHASGIFHILENVTVEMSGVTIQNGYGQTGILNYGTLNASGLLLQNNGGVYGSGGGLLNAGTASISHSALVNNDGSDPDAYEGGGIKNTGLLTLDNVTVSGNMGCGLLNFNTGQVDIHYSTFAYNDAHCEIGNLGSVQIWNSIIAGSLDASFFPAPGIHGGGTGTVGNCWGEIDSKGFNLDNAPPSEYSCGFRQPSDLLAVDPGLIPLSTYGESTPVLRLVPSSPAINSANPAECGESDPYGNSDQRGVARPQGGNCDRGAFELEIPAEQLEPLTPPSLPVEPSATPQTTSNPQAAFTKNAFCRKGPAVNYFDISSFTQGETAVIEARNQDSTWWYVDDPKNAKKCWVSGTTVEVRGSYENLPVMEGAKLPDVVTGFDVVDLACDPKAGKYSVKLAWQDNSDEGGYRIYRNSEEIVELKANVTHYTDDAPTGSEFWYEIVALNADGASDRMGAGAPQCE